MPINTLIKSPINFPKKLNNLSLIFEYLSIYGSIRFKKDIEK
jgi:hypothetical protein